MQSAVKEGRVGGTEESSVITCQSIKKKDHIDAISYYEDNVKV